MKSPAINFLDQTIKITDDTINNLENQIKAEKTGKPELNYKADRNKGEGRATDAEAEYTTKIKELYKPIEKILDKVDNKKPTDEKLIKDFNTAIDEQIEASEEIVEEYIPKIWEEKRQVGQKKREDLKLKPVKNDFSPKVKDALIEWQKMNIKKDMEILRWTILNKFYGKNYFVIAYETTKTN